MSTFVETPVWDWPSTGGDVEFGRLQHDWFTARRQADIALSRFGTFAELTRTDRDRTGRGVDVLIPLQLVDPRFRKLSPAEARAVVARIEARPAAALRRWGG